MYLEDNFLPKLCLCSSVGNYLPQSVLIRLDLCRQMIRITNASILHVWVLVITCCTGYSFFNQSEIHMYILCRKCDILAEDKQSTVLELKKYWKICSHCKFYATFRLLSSLIDKLNSLSYNVYSHLVTHFKWSSFWHKKIGCSCIWHDRSTF